MVFHCVPKLDHVDDDGAAARAAAASTPAPQTVPVGAYFQSDYQRGHSSGLDSIPSWDPSDFGCIDAGVGSMLEMDIDVDNLGGGSDGVDCLDDYACCWGAGGAANFTCEMYASVPDVDGGGGDKGGGVDSVCDPFGDSEASSSNFPYSSISSLGAGSGSGVWGGGVNVKTEVEEEYLIPGEGDGSLCEVKREPTYGAERCAAGWDRVGRGAGVANKVKIETVGGGDREASQLVLFKGGEVETMPSCGPSLRLDYEDVLLAWSERGMSVWVMEEEGQEADVGREESDLSDSLRNAENGVVPDIYMSLALPPPEAAAVVPLDPGGGDRKERVLRYREKRRNRLFSKKVRYEVRKLNAERRPRIKGRFVKRVGM